MREFDSGSLRSHIIHLSWPMVLANLLQNIAAGYVLFLLGRINVESLAAYSIVMSSFATLFSSVHGALINAAIALVSRKCGAGQHRLISRALPGMLVFGTLAFMAYAAIVFVSMGPVLSFFGAKGPVLDMAKEYTGILMISCVFMTFYSLLLGVSRGSGDSVTPLKVVLIMTGINAVLNTILTLNMQMGIKGVALSEMLSYAAAAAAYFIIFLRGLNGIKLTGFNWDKNIVKTYASLTWKSIIQNFSVDAGSMIMLRIISVYGNAFIAAYGIITRLNGFLMMIGWPITNSGAVIVGQNLGKKRRDRAMETVLQSFIVFCWAAVPAMLAYLVFPAQIMAVFTSDPAVIKYGIVYLLIMGPSLLFLAAGMTAQSAFNGAGSMGVPTIINLVAFVAIRTILAATLPSFMHLNESGIFWATSVSIIIFGVICWYVYKKERWTLKEI
jgi:putative MATE family efflux protein